MLQKYTKMTKEQLLDNADTLNREYSVYSDKEKKLRKARDKGLNWFWLIPIFGPVIRTVFANKRSKVPEFYNAITQCKEEMLKIELQLMFIDKLIKEDNFDNLVTDEKDIKEKKSNSKNTKNKVNKKADEKESKENIDEE